METSSISNNSATIPPISNEFVDSIYNKAKEFPQTKSIKQDYQVMFKSIERIKDLISENLDFFNNSEVFSEDFKKAMKRIDLSLDCYSKSFQMNIKNKSNKSITAQIQKDFILFSQLLLLFSTNLSNIYEKINNEKKHANSLVSLGIESVLFNLSVNIKPKDIEPYYKTNYLQAYGCYDIIANLKDNITAFQSVDGSGKTLCIPLILINRILEENVDLPFLIMTEPTQKIVDSKTSFFKEKIGHYLTITSDLNELIEIYQTKPSKIIFGILTPKDCLILTQRINKFFKKTRIIVDEIESQSFFVDVLLSLIKKSKKKFHLPIQFSMMSSLITENHRYIKFFGNDISITKLVDKPMFEVVTKSIKSTTLQAVIDESIRTISDMSKINPSIEEGNIVCFLPANDACKTLITSVTSLFNQSEESDEMRKVVFLKTSLKPNESVDSYFNRLRNEFELLNGLNNVEDNKNDVLYFIPVDLSNEFESSIYEIAQKNFPDDLLKINKLICSLPLNDPFTTDRLSVVIDSGLSKVSKFNFQTGLTASDLIQSPLESMSKIKGLLGRTMKGLYVSFHQKNEDDVPLEFEPFIVRGDLTKDILLLKEIGIDFDEMKLPVRLDFEYSFDALKKLNALDNENKITAFGKEINHLLSFNNSPLNVLYAGSVLYYKEKFNSKQKKLSFFFGFYLATLISMATDLIQENMTENLSTVFNEGSDIVTLINASQILLSSDITDNDKLRDFVESYGFSYSKFLIFRSILREAFEYIFESRDFSVSQKIESFIENHDVSHIVDNFIEQISLLDDSWKKLHSIDYKYVKNALGFQSRPTLIFSGNQRLAEWSQPKKSGNSEVRLTKRPGWNGIKTPMKCYFMNVCIYLNHHLIYGNIIHRVNDKSKGEIVSIELPKSASSHWFNVLIETYFSTEKLNVKVFTNEKKSNLFFISNAGERVFLSFIPLDEKTKSRVQHGIKQCIKLMPYVPRSVLIYRSGPKSLFEVTSIGTQDYDCKMASSVCGDILKRYYIDYCLNHLDELALSQPEIRICALFFNKECTVDDYNQKRLYFVCSKQDEKLKDLPNIKQLIEKHRKPRKVVQQMNERQNVIIKKGKNQKGENLGYFTFPPSFIHPSLLFHKETHSSIMRWFDQCKYAKVKLAVGQRFLMKMNDIRELQKHLRKDKEKIKKEMGLNFVAIPIPSKVYEKAYLTIRENPSWNYDSRFKVVITTQKESVKVNELVKKIADELDTNSNQHDDSNETLGCCYICDDSDNPTLTSNPITIYYNDGTTYTNKLCRDCLALNLQAITASFYNNGKINQESLELINTRPQPIPTVESKEIKDGMESWPQIPLGQLISVLINNDDELAGLVSAWLNSVQEYTIRNLALGKFTFCPYHPRKIFRIIKELDAPQIKCDVNGCKDVFCTACLGWHKPDFVCEEKKSGKGLVWQKKCPRCGVLTSKNGGCNHIACPKCGCHWCYVCDKGFKTAAECYAHMKKIHGNSFAEV